MPTVGSLTSTPRSIRSRAASTFTLLNAITSGIFPLNQVRDSLNTFQGLHSPPFGSAPVSRRRVTTSILPSWTAYPNGTSYSILWLFPFTIRHLDQQHSNWRQGRSVDELEMCQIRELQE